MCTKSVCASHLPSWHNKLETMVLLGSSTAMKSLGLGKPSSFFPKDAWPAPFQFTQPQVLWKLRSILDMCGAHRHVIDLSKHHWSCVPLLQASKPSSRKYGLQFVFKFQKDSIIVATCVYQRKKTFLVCFIFSCLNRGCKHGQVHNFIALCRFE